MNADMPEQIAHAFAAKGGDVPPDVMAELQSILRVHSITPEEMSYKWESYNLKMGLDDALTLTLPAVRDFKRDLSDSLEREARDKGLHDKRAVGATPRIARGANMFDMMEGVLETPMSAVSSATTKRRSNFATPAAKASKQHSGSSPTQGNAAIASTPSMPFTQRKGAGEIIESLNSHLQFPEPQEVPFLQSRIKLTANSDLNKFAFRPLAMKLSTASEILDDRIDTFLELLQDSHGLPDAAFGNPAGQSPSEIVAVGRIASDTPEGKLNPASIVLETSRRSGAGLRVPLKLDQIKSYDLFPGKIVGVRGTNPTGECFIVSEMLDIPLLGPAASSAADLDNFNQKLGSDEPQPMQPVNIITSAGPYTSDDNLSFEPLHALCERAENTRADVLILLGPFLDVEHPMVAAGDIPDLPASLKVSPDSATMTDVFRGLIGLPLERLAQMLPGIVIVMIPSVRDMISKHTAWPQDRIPKKGLGLPKQCFVVTNPITLALNEIVVAASSQDVLYELKRETYSKQNADSKPALERLSRSLIEQRHFCPLYPPTARENLPKPTIVEGLSENPRDSNGIGSCLDVSYLALGEWQNRRPDILITPSSLAPFVKVVDSVVVINPGAASKKRGTGHFAQLRINPFKIDEEHRSAEGLIAHEVYSRARVDVTRI